MEQAVGPKGQVEPSALANLVDVAHAAEKEAKAASAAADGAANALESQTRRMDAFTKLVRASPGCKLWRDCRAGLRDGSSQRESPVCPMCPPCHVQISSLEGKVHEAAAASDAWRKETAAALALRVADAEAAAKVSVRVAQ